MKKPIPTILILALILTVYTFANTQTPETIPHKYFYVAPLGNDDNNGSIDSPLRTFEAAKSLVKEFKRFNPDTPITVYFREGKYYQTSPLVFYPDDSGLPHAPITYSAYPGETPLLLGGKALDLKWDAGSDGILKAKVPDGTKFESLYINDIQQVLARYPNFDPETRIFNGTASDCISNGRVKSWDNPEGGYFHVIHKALWGGFHYRITGKNEKGELEMEGGWQNNRPENGIHPELRFVENIFEELDSEKEWFLDKSTSTLYLKPEKGVDPSTSNIEIAYLETFISIKGTENLAVSNISFEGFHFNRTIRTFMKTKDKLMRSDWTIYRGGSVFIEGASNISIKNCDFSQIGSNAIFINNYNRNITISGCHLSDIGANAICFVGDTAAVRNPKFIPYGPPVSDEELDLTPGPRTNNYPADCLVHDNLIHNIGKVEKQIAGVQISMAMNIRVSHNSIYDCPRAGINISEGAWGGHVIEYNDVFNTVLETSDHGSFNSWGRDRFWMVGNEQTEKRVDKYPFSIVLDAIHPTIIRNNRMRCDHGWDIDLDDGSSNYELYNNLCLTNGIKLREGYYRKVENNICINNAVHPHVWLKNSGDIIRGNIFGSRHYPIRVNYWGTNIDYNWFMSETDLLDMQKLGIEENSLSGNPVFVNPELGDYRIDTKSPVYSLGFKNFPMDRFGVLSKRLKMIAKTPEIPEILVVRKTERLTYEFFGGEIKNLENSAELSATGMHDKNGVLIISPPEKGAFENISLKKGDVILFYNEKPVKDIDFFIRNMKRFSNPDAAKSVLVWRNQGEVKLGMK